MLADGRAVVYAGCSLHPLHPSIEKKDRAQISAEEQWRLDRFEDAVALEAAFARWRTVQ